MVNRIFYILFFIAIPQLISAQSMEWLCHPGRFSDIGYMGYDLFKVKDDNTGKWGVVSNAGKVVIEAKYDSITVFTEERALLLDRSGDMILGILDRNGRLIKSCKEGQLFTTRYPYYKEGYLSYRDANGLCGYINSSGKTAIDARFYLAAPFQDGIAVVQYADDGSYGLINKSGGSAIISDTRYKFLSSVVDGFLFALNPSSRGGDLLRIMKLNGNQLEAVKRLESKMFVDISDDFTYILSQNGHHYYIDDQWRICGANYRLQLPYQIVDEELFVIEDLEVISKQSTRNGLQITYKGQPILEHIFDDVRTYEGCYAIVRAKDKSVGILRLNPSAGIEIIEPVQVFDFYHNPLQEGSSFKSKDIDPDQYIEVDTNIENIDPEQLKCYINEGGYLRYAPLKLHNGVWKLHIPYFCPDTEFGNIISKKIDIAITYDGLDWMHRMITLSSKHEKGYEVELTGNNLTDENGYAKISIVVKSINGSPAGQTRIDISGYDTVYMSGDTETIPIDVYVPEGESKTLEYTVTVSEPGCPVIRQSLRLTVTNPVKEKSVEDIILI